MSTMAPKPFEQLVALADRYLEGALSEGELARLDRLLTTDARAAHAFAQYARQAGAMREAFGDQQRLALGWEAYAAAAAQDQRQREKVAQAVEELARQQDAEGFGEPAPLEMDPPFSMTAELPGQRRRRIRRQKRLAAAAAIAAAAIACTLLAVLIASLVQPAPQTPQTAQTHPEPGLTEPGLAEPGRVGPEDPAPVPAHPVATLTQTHNATWGGAASAALKPGDKLHPNTRLTLTAGFAEITTARGAVAILQAPATIELTDSDNALRLHTGKLVGICETPASKGFVVRTPHMDITDLGTRFGVDVMADRQTEVHVAEGEVSVRTMGPDASHATDEPVRLHKGEAALVSSGDRSMKRMAADTLRFEALVPITIELPGTGQGLATNQADANWQIISYEGNDLKVPHIPKVSDREWFHNDRATSQWLSWNNTQGIKPADGYNNYLFQTQVTIPASIDPATARIELSQTADARVTAIIINGQLKPLRKADRNPNDPWHTHEVIDQHLVAGTNTIVFEVQNHRWDAANDPGPVGLRVQWKLHGYGPR